MNADVFGIILDFTADPVAAARFAATCTEAHRALWKYSRNTAVFREYFYYFVKTGNLRGLSELFAVKRGTPNAYDNYALKYAAANGKVQLAEYLLTFDRVTQTSSSAVICRIAMMSGNVELVKLVMSKYSPSCDTLKNMLVKAADMNNAAAVNMILQLPTDFTRETLITAVITAREPKIRETLLVRIVKKIKKSDSTNFDMLELLQNIFDTSQIRDLKLLIESAPIDWQTIIQIMEDPSMHNIRLSMNRHQDHTEIVKIMLNRGLQVTNKMIEDAVCYGNLCTLRLLLDRHIEAEAGKLNVDYLICISISYGSAENMMELLKRYGSPAVNNEALYGAVKARDFRKIEQLLKIPGIDPYSKVGNFSSDQYPKTFADSVDEDDEFRERRSSRSSAIDEVIKRNDIQILKMLLAAKIK